jgi:putative nucleotidyltransferase with HDIG domain
MKNVGEIQRKHRNKDVLADPTKKTQKADKENVGISRLHEYIISLMIPTGPQVKILWDKYKVPEQKRIHLTLVAQVAMQLADSFQVNKKLLLAAALLHDIDKAVGGSHPEMAVRILNKEKMGNVGDVVRTHSLHCILNPNTAPKTWEQKLLYLADKMVKYDIVGVDRRFALWRAEDLPHDARIIVDECYPKVKKLEQEVLNLAGILPSDLQ